MRVFSWEDGLGAQTSKPMRRETGEIFPGSADEFITQMARGHPQEITLIAVAL